MSGGRDRDVVILRDWVWLSCSGCRPGGTPAPPTIYRGLVSQRARAHHPPLVVFRPTPWGWLATPHPRPSSPESPPLGTAPSLAHHASQLAMEPSHLPHGPGSTTASTVFTNADLVPARHAGPPRLGGSGAELAPRPVNPCPTPRRQASGRPRQRQVDHTTGTWHAAAD